MCLLERGKEKWPGEYPSELKDAMKEVHVSGDFAPGGTRGKWVEGGDPTGLYHLIVGDGQNAFVGNGLGGTSLLNANVFLEADSRVLEMGVWPEELKGEGSWKKCKLSSSLMVSPVPKPTNLLETLTRFRGLPWPLFKLRPLEYLGRNSAKIPQIIAAREMFWSQLRTLSTFQIFQNWNCLRSRQNLWD